MDEYNIELVEVDDGGDLDAGDLAGDPDLEDSESDRRHGSGRRNRRAKDALAAKKQKLAADNALPDTTAEEEAQEHMGPAGLPF